MKNYSIWKELNSKIDCNSITQNMAVDTLIIGGGITGLSTLYHLRNSGLHTILVERNTCGNGVSSRSTAKITFLQEKILYNLRKFVSTNTAKLYLKSQIDAMNQLINMIKKEKIDCDLQEVSSYLFTCKNKNLKLLEDEYQFLKNNGIKVTKVNEIPFDISCKLAIKVDHTYEFHILKFLNAIKKLCAQNIYENSKAEDIKKEKDYYICKVNGYDIKATNVIIATHYPYFIVPMLFPFKNHIETSFIGAKKVKDFKNINAINVDSPTISLRYHTDAKNNYLIYLFDSLLTCNVKDINKHFDNLVKNYNFDYIWSNHDIITNDYLPFIGRVYKNNDNLLIGCGYNTWGMTNGFLAGTILADITLKKDNPYELLFDPHRKMNLSKILRLPVDIASSTKAIMKSGKANVNNSKVIYTVINGTNVAIYVDEKGNKHTVLNRCPHMKCGLIFNETEKTWDCLCHGSRFNIDGICIEGPSNFNISYKD